MHCLGESPGATASASCCTAQYPVHALTCMSSDKCDVSEMTLGAAVKLVRMWLIQLRCRTGVGGGDAPGVDAGVASAHAPS